MPKPLIWTDEQDAIIRTMRAGGADWDAIAARLCVARWTAIERGRRLGAHIDPTPEPEPEGDPERPALAPGHDIPWSAIMANTPCLAGAAYPPGGVVR